jgi:hypothetical protein
MSTNDLDQVFKAFKPYHEGRDTKKGEEFSGITVAQLNTRVEVQRYIVLKRNKLFSMCL